MPQIVGRFGLLMQLVSRSSTAFCPLHRCDLILQLHRMRASYRRRKTHDIHPWSTTTWTFPTMS
jgi:hypothetical protein